jgi:hypothetical protein
MLLQMLMCFRSLSQSVKMLGLHCFLVMRSELPDRIVTCGVLFAAELCGAILAFK